MYFVFLLVFSLATWTEQHISYPMNYCNMATTCIHDQRAVCASTPDGCSKRSFLDQCDMYEYNCDYNTRYQETCILYCIFSPSTPYVEESVPLLLPHTKTTESTYTPDNISIIDKNNIEQSNIPATTTQKYVSTSSTKTSCICSCHSSTIATTSNTMVSPCSISTVTSTISTTGTRTMSKNTITPLLSTSTRSFASSNTLNTKNNQYESQSTTESRITTSISPSITTITLSTAEVTTSNPVTKSKTNTLLTKITTNLNVNTIANTEAAIEITTSGATIPSTAGKTEVNYVLTNMTSINGEQIIGTYEKTKLKKTDKLRESTVCCQRPKTWDTTKENVKTVIINEDENKIDYTVQSSKKTSSVILPSTYSSKSTKTVQNTDATTFDLTTTTSIMPTAIKNNTTSTDLSTTIQTSQAINLTTTATTVCINCQRPTAWETTTAKELPYIFIPKPTPIPETNIQSTTSEEAEKSKVSITQAITTSTSEHTNALETFEEESNEMTTEKTITYEDYVTYSNQSGAKAEKIVQYVEETDYSDFLENTDSTKGSNNKAHDGKIVLKMTEPYPMNTWWYPTQCISGNCERPITWQTTRRRQGIHRYNY